MSKIVFFFLPNTSLHTLQENHLSSVFAHGAVDMTLAKVPLHVSQEYGFSPAYASMDPNKLKNPNS